jgi:osmoprotectant transport system permease protein
MDVDGFLRSLGDAIALVRSNPADFLAHVETHLELSGLALAIGLGVCFPLGVLASRRHWVSLSALNAFGVARAVPSVAILFLAYPVLGLGFKPALLALAVLACPPILINTNVGFRAVDPAIREAAYGMGFTTVQVLTRIEFPLALPVVLAGVRTVTVEVIASAALATFIGAGGLGEYINNGLSNLDTSVLLEGAVPVALLTLAAEIVLGGLEMWSRRAAGVPAG